MGKAAARAALETVAPELAIPAEVAARLVGRLRHKPEEPSVQGNVVVLPKPPLIELKKAQIRSITRGGQSVVVIEPARGLSVLELLVTLVLIGGGVEGLKLARDYQRNRAQVNTATDIALGVLFPPYGVMELLG